MNIDDSVDWYVDSYGVTEVGRDDNDAVESYKCASEDGEGVEL